MTIFHAVFLGIVEGITEFLPISSTGHLILTSSLLQLPSTEFLKTFEIVIQLGAILAVVVLYWKALWRFDMIKKLVVAFIPTAVIGLALYHVVKTYLLGNTLVVVVALFVGGVVLIAFEQWHETPDDETNHYISDKNAFFIGVAQAVAIIPGVSRSAATIIGGRALGISRSAVVEFSFLLAVPTMLAASGLDLLHTGFALTTNEWALLAVGFVAAFLVALATIKWFLTYIRSHSFTSFGIYRIFVALAAYFILIR